MKSLLVILSVLTFFTITPAMAQTFDDGYAAYKNGEYHDAQVVLLPLAESGHGKAMNIIGRMYDDGRGYVKDTKTACDWYEKSANAGYASGQNNYAVCFKRGDGREFNLDKAILWWEKAAEQGDVDAQLTLAVNLREIDREKAIYWGQKAVDAGSASARVAMWSAKLPHTGPQATYMDIACEFVMTGLLDKPWGYCD